MGKKSKRKVVTQDKNPNFPPRAAVTARKLQEMIDAGGENAPLASVALEKLTELWLPPNESGDRSGLIGQLIGIMFELFPGGKGLPE